MPAKMTEIAVLPQENVAKVKVTVTKILTALVIQYVDITTAKVQIVAGPVKGIAAPIKKQLPHAKTTDRERHVRNIKGKEDVERENTGRGAKRLVKDVETNPHAAKAMSESPF